MRGRIKALVGAIFITFICAVFLLSVSTFLSRAFGDEAADRVLEAAYIQFGVKREVDLVSLQAADYANHAILSKSAALRLGVGAFAAYHRQCLKWPWTGTATMTIYKDKAELSFLF